MVNHNKTETWLEAQEPFLRCNSCGLIMKQHLWEAHAKVCTRDRRYFPTKKAQRGIKH